MTDDELKALVGENSLAIREMREKSQELDQRWEQARQKSDQRWEQYLAESERARRKSDQRWEQYHVGSEQARLESERIWQEVLASRRETDRLITHLNRGMGRLGNELGGYSESLIRPSLKRALREQFGMTNIFSPLNLERGGEAIEIDVVGHAGSQRREVFLAEIKSQLRADAIEQLYDHMRRLPHFFPEYRGKKLFGILAALEVPEDLKTQVLGQGIYVATIKDDVFEIVPPDDFEPQAYGLWQA